MAVVYGVLTHLFFITRNQPAEYDSIVVPASDP
jgi:hypothetical protein